MPLFGLLKPKWKNRKPEVRLAAVEKLGAADVGTLKSLAEADEDPRVRLAALGKIEDVAVLQELCSRGLSPELEKVARAKVDRQLCELALSAAVPEVRLSAVERIEAPELVARIAAEASSPAVRLEALRRVADPEVLCRIAEANCGKEVARVVVEKIGDEALLRRIARTGGNKVARRLAEEKLAAIAEARNRPSPEDLREAEFSALLRRALDAARAESPIAADRLDELESAWGRLDATGAHPRGEEFRSALARARDLATERAGRAEEERMESERRARTLSACEEICQAVEALVGSSADDADEQVQRAAGGWPLSGIESEDEPLARLAVRFETARGRFAEARDRRAAEGRSAAELTEECRRAEERIRTGELDGDLGPVLRLEKKAEESRFEFADRGELDRSLESLRRARAERESLLAEAASRARQEDLERRRELCSELEAQVTAEDRADAAKRVKELRRAWKNLGETRSSEQRALDERFQVGLDGFAKRQAVFQEEQGWKRWANKKLKEELCVAVEALDGDADLARVAGAVREAQARWKAMGPVPRADAEKLWKRFRAACDRNFERCKPHLEELERERATLLERKEELCRRAEELADSIDWKQTAEALRALQAEWKEIGAGPLGEDRRLYARFRRACSQFFARRKERLDEIEAERRRSREEKEKLCQEAEAVAESRPANGAKSLRELQVRWKEVGPAGRGEQELWERFRGACDRFFAWLDEERTESLRKKEALCEELEAAVAGLNDETDPKELTAKIADLQRRWKEIGPAPKDRSDELWQRFRRPCDEFFGARREEFARLDEERRQNEAKKEDLLRRAEDLVETGEPKGVGEGLRALQDEWKSVGPATREREGELRQRFQTVCNDFFAGRRRKFEETAKLRMENLRHKEALCLQLERIVGAGAEQAGSREFRALSLADQLKIALESNFALSSPDVNRDLRLDEVRRIQQEWKKIGPVPRENDKGLWERYRRLLDLFYGDQRDGATPSRPS